MQRNMALGCACRNDLMSLFRRTEQVEAKVEKQQVLNQNTFRTIKELLVGNLGYIFFFLIGNKQVGVGDSIADLYSDWI